MDDLKDPKDRGKKGADKLAAIRAVKELSGNSDWTITQELMQEVVASYTVANPDKLPPVKTLVEALKGLIEERYATNIELKDLLVESVPAVDSFYSKESWFKKKNWDEAVWGKIRGSGLFTKEKRAQMINALYHRGMDKSDIAAKLWLTLSGDYSEKMDINTDKSIDMYREIQNVLLNKKKQDD